MSTFFEKFRRVTASTNYQPEIDGLRFVALFMVVAFMHIPRYINQIFHDNTWVKSFYWRTFLTNGGNGVLLFFVISGFILSLPFAQMYLRKEKPVNLQWYYLRRLTRLEPPYLIVLTVLFVAEVFLIKKYDFGEALPHYLASVFYIHNFVYKEASTILPLAWSLEVEVQFYVVAPLLFLIFLVRKAAVRRLIMALIIIAGLYYWYNDWGFPHLLKYLHFFFAGIFFADLYVSAPGFQLKNKTFFFIGLLSLVGLIFFNSLMGFGYYLLKMGCMFLFFISVLFNLKMKSLFSKTFLIVVGGMCYSIYMLHQAIVSFFGKLIMKLGIDYTNTNYIPAFMLFFLFVVLILSSIYFLVVEKPFMKFNSRKASI